MSTGHDDSKLIDFTLHMRDFPEESVIEIEGIRYHYDFFVAMSERRGMTEGTLFKMGKREDGNMHIIKYLN